MIIIDRNSYLDSGIHNTAETFGILWFHKMTKDVKNAYHSLVLSTELSKINSVEHLLKGELRHYKEYTIR